jgi:uncharacterized delta-60 repeat protein
LGSRVIENSTSATAVIYGVTMTGGNDSFGGGILNDGTLTVDHAAVSNNYGTYVGGIVNIGDLTITYSTITGNHSGGYAGGITSDGNLEIDSSTVSGNTAYGYGGGVYVQSGGLSITGSTISNNSAQKGGGLAFLGSTATIDSSTFAGNFAGSNGGAIFSYGDVAITNTVITTNTAYTNGGGISNGGDLTITNSTIANNSGYYEGGGISNTGDLTIASSVISDNTTSGKGGGAFSNGTLDVTASTFSGNYAHDGGAIFNNAGEMTVADSDLSSNNVYYDGGAIYSISGGITLASSIIRSTVSANSTGYDRGGGIFAIGDFDVDSSLITDSWSFYGGGGIDASGGTLSVVNSTITGNYSDYGVWGIYAGTLAATDSTIVDNGILALNPSTLSGTIVSGYSTLVGSFAGTNNFVSDGSGGLSTASSAHNHLGTSSSHIDPKLSSLGYYGGPIKSFALLPGSPAIAAGSSFGVTEDQRGFARSGTFDIGAFQTQPQPLMVNTADDGSGNFGDLTLRDAINLADAEGGNRTITFDSSLYGATIYLNGSPLDLNDTTGTLTIQGLGADRLTIDGSNLSGVFTIAYGSNAAITGLTVTHGSGSGIAIAGGITNNGTLAISDLIITYNSGDLTGGGIKNTGDLTVVDSKILVNTSSIAGGGILNQGMLQIVTSTISGNVADMGGGIYSKSSYLDITDSIISDNTAYSSGGGLIIVLGAATIAHSTISGNTAETGGGIYSGQSDIDLLSSIVSDGYAARAGGIDMVGGTIDLDESLIDGNHSTAGSGGGMVLEASASATISNSTISGNVSTGNGGAVDIEYGSGGSIVDSTISGNHSVNGGGVSVAPYSGISIVDSLFYDNQATGNGGGLYSSNGGISLLNATITGNTAICGGGIYITEEFYFGGGLTVVDSTISGNSASNYAGGIQSTYAYDTQFYGSIIAGNTGVDLATPSGSFVGSYNLIGGDPKLGALSNNGGPTRTLPLLPDSPALSAGHSFSGAITDQRGIARSAGTPDIGAFEFQAPSVSLRPLTTVTAGLPLTLRAPSTSPDYPTPTSTEYPEDTFSYQWAVTYGGTPLTLPYSGATDIPYINITPSYIGSWSVSVTVTDNATGLQTTQTDAFDVVAGTPYVVGPTATQSGAAYTLSLYPAGATFDHWYIDWGDGTTSSPDISTATSTATYITHTFTTSPANYVITATAKNGSTVVASDSIGLDAGFNTTGRNIAIPDGAAEDMVVQPDGHIVILSDGRLLRFAADGTPDASFGTIALPTDPDFGTVVLPTNATWTVLAVDKNGEIAVGGSSGKQLATAVYAADGKTLIGEGFSNEFGTGPSTGIGIGTGIGVVSANAIAFSNGRIAVVGGDVEAYHPRYSGVIATFDIVGNRKWQFENVATGSTGYAYEHVAIDPSSGYVDATRDGGQYLDQVDNTGALTRTIVPADPAYPTPIVAIDANGNLLLGGDDIERFSPDGTPDAYFGTAGDGTLAFTFGGASYSVRTFAPQSNGSLIVIGQDGDGFYVIGRYKSDGTPDTTFGVGGFFASAFASKASEQRPQLIPANGGYDVIAIAEDGNVDIARLFMKNRTSVSGPPTVALNTIPAAQQNSPVTITAIVTSGGGLNDVLTYHWIVTKDGSAFTLPNGGVTGGPSLTFTPDEVSSDWTVSLTVADNTPLPDGSFIPSTTVSPTTFSVGVPPLNILGPAYANEGSTVQFLTTTPWVTSTSWSVTVGGTTTDYHEFTGAAFSFTPSHFGTYTINVSADDEGVTKNASIVLTVQYVQPIVSILGSAIGFAGHAMTFSSNVAQAPGMNDDLTYSWSFVNPSGGTVSIDNSALSSVTLPVGTDSTFVGTYEVQLTVADHHDGSCTLITQSIEISILPQPSSDGFSYAAIPLADYSVFNGGWGINFSNYATVEGQEADGKIIVAGYSVYTSGWDNYGSTGIYSQYPHSDDDQPGDGPVIFIARFNSDLTLDTTFGLDHTGFVLISTPDIPALVNQPLCPLAMTFNPVNQDIVLVGGQTLDPLYDSGTNFPNGAWVGEFLSSPRIATNGEMMLAGSIDPYFNQGNLFLLQNNPNLTLPSGESWNSLADSVVALGDGSLLVGGLQQIQNEEGYRDSDEDFLLFKITSISTDTGGVLDTSFGTGGIADNTWVDGSATNLSTFGISAIVKSIVIQPDGGGYKIIVGGYASADPVIATPFNYDYQEVGFMLERYNSNGTLDNDVTSGFGFDHSGKVFTTSTDFDVDGQTAYLGGLELQPGTGDLIAAGIVADALPYPDYHYFDNSFQYPIGIATYDANGCLVNTFLDTSLRTYGPGAYEDGVDSPDTAIIDMGSGPWFDNVPRVNFTSDGSVLVSIIGYVDSQNVWQLAEFTPSGAGGIIATFSSPDDSMSIVVPGEILATDDGIYVTGHLMVGTPLASEIGAYPLLIKYNVGEFDQDLSAQAIGNGTVNLSWHSHAGTDGYEVEYAEGTPETFTLLGIAGPEQENFNATGLDLDATYYFELIPFTGSTSGAITTSDPSQIANATTFSSGQGTLMQAFDVPIVSVSGSPTQSDTLTSGNKYLIVVSGTAMLAQDYNGVTAGASYDLDAGYWYVSDGPSINGIQLDNEPFGLGISGSLESPTDNVIPDWGPLNSSNHYYAYVVTGDDNPLTFQFHNADGTSLSPDYSSQMLHIQIFDLSATEISSSSTPVRIITSPISSGNGLVPTISTGTQINIIAAALDASDVSWKLQLRWADGTVTSLASGSSIGQLPLLGLPVTTLDPTRYPNGTYTLELTDGIDATVVYSERITIQTIVKADDLTQSAADLAFSTSIGGISVTRTYDSSQSNVDGELGNGWSLNILDSQLQTTVTPEAYDPDQFSSESLRAGDAVEFHGPPTETNDLTNFSYQNYVFVFDPTPVDPSDPSDLDYTATFTNVYKGYGDPVYFDWSSYFSSGLDTDATLSVIPKSGSGGGGDLALTYDPTSGQFLYNKDGNLVAFNPADPSCDLFFQVSAGGTSFTIDPATGQEAGVQTTDSLIFSFRGFFSWWSNDENSDTFPVEDSGLIYFHGDNHNPAVDEMSVTLNSGTISFPAVADYSGDITAAGEIYDNSVMRAGDLVSLTTPDSGKITFEFDPKSANDNWAGSASLTSQDYIPNFISLSGSDAALTLIPDPSSFQSNTGNELRLMYDKTDNEFLALSGSNHFIGFDPGNPIFGMAYQLTTSNGHVYVINATTGKIESCSTIDGTIIYSVAQDGNIVDGNIIDADGNALLNIQWSSDAVPHILSIQVPGQSSIAYRYDSGNLVAATDQQGNATTYSYNDAYNSHHLTGITNSLGIAILAATYQPVNGLQSDGQLTSVTDRNGINFPIDYTLADGGAGIRTVSDAGGNIIETILDQYGNTIRSIAPTTHINDDGSIFLSGYLVSATQVNYALSQAGLSSPGIGAIAVLESVSSYSPFQINPSFSGSDPNPDPDQQRYTEQPADSTLIQETTYVIGGEFIGQVQSSTQQISFVDDGHATLQKTINFNYAVVDKSKGTIKPLTVITEIDTPDGDGFDRNIQTIASSEYDDQGNVLYSVNATLQTDPSNSLYLLAEGTGYTYGGGLVTDTFKVTADIDAVITPDEGIKGTGLIVVVSLTRYESDTTQNQYYAITDPSIGAVKGQLEWTIDAAGQKTVYAYNSSGQAVLTYTYKTLIGTAGLLIGVWTGTTNIYDDEGRLTDTYQATYYDATGGPEFYMIGAGEGTVVVDTNKNHVYSQPLRISHADYNDLGEVADTIDQLGGTTSTTYNSNGQTIQTISPNGTVVRTVYDDKDRAIWVTQPFDPDGSLDNVIATHTVYNDLGQVTETDQYVDTDISDSGSLIDEGARISRTLQFYNSKGQTVETDNLATGLRTGTIFYPNGQVAYSGTLLSTAYNEQQVAEELGTTVWYNTLDTAPQPTLYFSTYTTNIGPQYDSELHLLYTEVIDQNANAAEPTTGTFVGTKTYQDGNGRTIRTVYPDGSYTETLYSFGGSSVSKDQEGDTIDNPTDWQGFSAFFGSETVTIAQRMPGESLTDHPLILTYNVNDMAGRMVDVYMPAVPDMDPGDSATTYYETSGYVPVNPHWSYVYDSAGNETIQVSSKEQAAYQTWVGAGSGITNSSDNSYYTPFAGGTTFAYDQYGRQVEEILPDNSSATPEISTTQYNQFGQTTISVDFNGHATAYTYDENPITGQGHLTGQYLFAIGTSPFISGTSGSINISAAGQSITYTYDGLGRQHTVTDDSRLTTNYYDAFGNVIEEQTPEGTIHYTYDQATQQHVQTYTDNTDTLYAYDSRGRLVNIYVLKAGGVTYGTYTGDDTTTNQPTFTGSPLTTTYTYDGNGNKLAETLPTGEVTTYIYDSLNRLKTVLEKQDTITLFDQSYILNDDGSRASVTETQRQTDGTYTTTETAWTYDADGRLIGETTTLVPLLLVLPADDSPTGEELALTWSDTTVLLNGAVTTGAWVSSDYGGSYSLSGDAGVALLAPDAAALLAASTSGIAFAPGNWGLMYNDGAGGGFSWSLSNLPTAVTDSEVQQVDPTGSSDSSAGSALAALQLVPVGTVREYTDTYTFDLQNNRMGKAHIGPTGGVDQTTTYIYNGDDEQTSELSVNTGTAQFSNTTSVYDANGSLTNQYADSPASNDDFGTGSPSSDTAISNLSDTASATTTGVTGAVITTFGSSDVTARATVLLPNGDLLVVGSAVDDNSNQDIALIAYNATTGLLDTDFGVGGYVLTNINGHAVANAVTYLTDAVNPADFDILIAGTAHDTSGNPNFALVEYHSDGSLNTSMGSSGATPGPGWVLTNINDNAVANAITVLSGGDIVLAGYANGPSGHPQSVALARYSPTGGLVSSFGTASTGIVLTEVGTGSAAAKALVVTSDGSLLIAGYGSDTAGQTAILAEYTTAGVLVSSFGVAGIAKTDISISAAWNAIALSGSNIFVAGYTNDVWTNSIALAAFTSAGILDSSFGNAGLTITRVGIDAVANTITLVDSDILLTGYGMTIGVSPHQSLLLARYDSAGLLEPTFGVSGILLPPTASGGVTSVAYAAALISETSTSTIFAAVGLLDTTGIYLAEYEIHPQTTTYTYDLRNKMVGYTDGTTTATYTYDDAGNRVAETVDGTTTLYLTDTANPIGYAQPIEAKSSSTAAPSMTYILGDRVLGQVDGAGTISYLLSDGHGSTRLLTDSSGVITATFNYDAFGMALNFDPSTAGTVFLFGGDAVYDLTSGLYFHGNGVRATLGFLFIQRDSIAGNTQDPISLHKYLYADANPINGADPSGHYYLALLEDSVEETAETGEAIASIEEGAATEEEGRGLVGAYEEEEEAALESTTIGENGGLRAADGDATGGGVESNEIGSAAEARVSSRSGLPENDGSGGPIETIPAPSGKATYRVPDFPPSRTFPDVWEVKGGSSSLSSSSQFRDMLQFAQGRGGRLIIWTNRPIPEYGLLAAAVKLGQVVIKAI